MRWNKVDVPHKGWEYIGMEDLGEGIGPDNAMPYEQCEMCGKEKIRYVHLLRHPDFNGELRVGCECAAKMICDYETPRERERNLKNRVNRRNNFMKQKWHLKVETGNYTLHYKGDNITIMRSKFGPGWGVIFKGKTQWEYNGRKINDLETAKTVAFNLFDELHESHNQEQPYWDGDRWIYF